ncbi:hypothetical protein ACCO45_008572 [Purpureocillium lilacinum]|uniref:Uncharacterized protein n=1 Tax=Purpureocillium lilacinum TaxID=33203 RepID=A0ACC4DNX0_PURLI
MAHLCCSSLRRRLIDLDLYLFHPRIPHEPGARSATVSLLARNGASYTRGIAPSPLPPPPPLLRPEHRLTVRPSQPSRPLAATRKRVPPLTHRQGQGPNSNPALGLGVGTTLPGGHIIAPRLRLVGLSPSFSRCPPATSASHFLGSCLLAPSSVYILPALFFLTLCR